jgi:hypothetical protein
MSEPVAKRRPMIDLDEFERRLRQPSAASRGMEDDPLAELARLVGSQDDPYRTMFGPNDRQRAAEARDKGLPGEPDAQERLIGGDFSAIEAGILNARRRYDDVDDDPPAATQELPPASIEADYSADYSDHWTFDEPGEPGGQIDQDLDEPRSRRPLYLMAAIIILGIAGIGASFTLKSAPSGPREIATIKASQEPAKIAPESTESKDTSVQDVSILNKTAQPAPSATLDNVEQPVDLAQVQEKAPRIIPLDGSAASPDVARSGAASVPVPAPPPAPVQAQSQSAPLTIAGLIEPKKVKTVSVRPDGTLIPTEEAQPDPVIGTIVDVPLPAPRPALPAARASTPKVAERVPTTPEGGPKYAARVDQGAVTQQPPADAQPSAPARTGNYSVQLAAPESEAEARAIQVKLLKKHAAELSGFRTSIRRAQVGEKTVYRVRVGGLSQEEANALCQKVQSGGSACFVARN